MSHQSEPPTMPAARPGGSFSKSGFVTRLHGGVIAVFASLARFSILHPKTALVGVLLVVGLSLPGLWRLRLKTDGRALLTPTAPEVIYDNEIRKKFGIEDQIVILIRSERSVLNAETVQLVRDLTADCLRIPGIRAEHVMSLATESSFRMRPGTLIHETFLEPPLKTEKELNQLREDLRQIQLYTSTAIAADEKATVILVGVPPGSDRAKLYQQIRTVVDGRKEGAEMISVTGAPVAESLLGIHILEDLGVPKALLGTSTRGKLQTSNFKLQTPETERPHGLAGRSYKLRSLIARKLGLVPIAIVVMMLIFLVSFRSFVAMLLPLPGVGATILFAFGLMGWCGVPVYLTIAVMPVLLTATGVTNDIYLFSRYFGMLRERPNSNRKDILREAFETMAGPVAATSLTAAIGFFSFACSPLGPVRAFGIFTGAGVLFGLFFSFTAVPAMLALISPKSKVQSPKSAGGSRVEGRGSTSGQIGRWLGEFGAWVMRRRWWVAGFITLVMALTPLGLRKLQVQDSWTDAFDPDSEFRRTTAVVNQEFYGMHLLFVSVDLPAVLKGEVRGSAVTRDGLMLPGNLVGQPAVIAGSPITIKISNVKLQASGNKQESNSKPAEAGTPNKESEESRTRTIPTQWRSHIEMVSVVGTNLAVRIPPQEIPESVWRELSKAEKVEFEIVAHSQVRPEVIKEIADLGNFIRERKQYSVGGVLSPFDYLSTTRFMARPNDPQARVLPNDAGEIKLMWDYYGLARGRERLHQVVDTNYWQSLTTVLVKDANFVDTARLMSDVRGYERERLAPKGIKLGFAGDVALSQSLVRGIVSTQMQSLAWSLLGIFLVTSLLGRSWRWGFYCVLPSVLAIVIKFAVMGWTGIPLGVATSMFAAMTLGIGVNCAIQLLGAYDLGRAEGLATSEAMIKAMKLSGPAALINTLAVSTGFGVLMLSQVPANARLGFLVVLGLAGCFVLTMLALPVLLAKRMIRP